MTRNWIGRRTPLYATSSGKVLLAFADETTRKLVLESAPEPLTEHTIVDPDALTHELAEVVRRGWASTSEELEIGLTAVAAPIRDGGGRVTAAVSASGPSFRLTPDSFEDVAEHLLGGAAEISSRLGYYGD